MMAISTIPIPSESRTIADTAPERNNRTISSHALLLGIIHLPNSSIANQYPIIISASSAVPGRLQGNGEAASTKIATNGCVNER
jgi:hypothetical protein